MSIPRALRNDLQDDGLGQSQFVETRKIQPTSGSTGGGSQGQLRFLLPKQGILDKDSYISFQVLAPAANSTNYRLPISAGAYSVLDTATLFAGGVQVQQTRGLASLLTMKQYYRTPHDRDKKQSIRNGCFLAQMVDTRTAGGVNGVWSVDTGEDWCEDTSIDAKGIEQGYFITQNQTDAGTGPALQVSPEWRIYLSDLFPLLYNENLPLGLLDDEMSIVIDLGPDNCRGERTIVLSGQTWNTADGNALVVGAELNIDLIFYDDPIGQPTTMDEMRGFFQSGERLVFTDNAFIQSTQPAAAGAGEVANNVLLGLDRQVVRHILMATPILNDYSAPANSTAGNGLLGQYCSKGSQVKNTLQLNINNQPVYPNELDGDNKLFNQLSQVFPTPFKVNSAMSSWVGQVDANGAPVATSYRITDKTLYGHPQTILIGEGHYYGINLSKTYRNVANAGTSIGRQPVELVLTHNAVASDLTGRQLINLGVL
jgi:hypothetical protein